MSCSKYPKAICFFVKEKLFVLPENDFWSPVYYPTPYLPIYLILPSRRSVNTTKSLKVVVIKLAPKVTCGAVHCNYIT